MANKHPLQIHGSHIIKLIPGPIETKKPGLVHAGKFMCVKCNKLIKWATQDEIDFYQYRYGNNEQIKTTYQGFVDRYFTHTHKPVSTKIKEEIIYLVVTYEERNEVKKFGAKWSTFHELWYVKSSNPHIQKLKKYIHPDDYSVCGIELPKPIDTKTIQQQKLQQLLKSLKNNT